MKIPVLPLRFSLREVVSPTYFNLSLHLKEKRWKQTRFNFLAHFSETNFQFDSNAAYQLEFKDSLAQMLQNFCSEIMPLTYCIHDLNWPLVLNQLLKEQDSNQIWILKPAQLNNGQHIKIIKEISQLEHHFLQSKRLGGRHVLQHYLQPHLLKGPSQGHKYSLRMFVVLTNYAGAFLYPEGYFNVALRPYPYEDFSDLSPHLTNEHLKSNVLNVIQLPSQQIHLFSHFYQQIKSILAEVIYALQCLHPLAFTVKKARCLAIFGFDFMIDSNEKIWLLEANHGPCFPTSPDHALYSLYYEFWQAFIESFILPIAQKERVEKIVYQRFEPII